jgi:hypothetical protein
VALQSLDGQWLLLSSKHRLLCGTLKRSRSLRCNETISGECVEVMRLITPGGGFAAEHHYQQDGAPPQWSSRVREILTRTFSDRWIGRDRPISWPPRSPDITPLGFFFWGYVKDGVYSTRVPDLPTVRDRIRDVIASVTPDMLDRTWQEIENRLDIIRTTSGSHEVY